MTVVVFGNLRFPPDQMDRVRPHLQRFVETTRREDGCLAYDVAEDLFDLGLIRFSEHWPDDASLKRHLQAPHLIPWRAACSELGLIGRDFTAFDADRPREV